MDDLIFITHRVPLPPEKGGDVRAWRILRQLAGAHRVHLGCFSDGAKDAQGGEALEEICASVFCAPRSLPVAHIKSLAAFAQGEALGTAFSLDVRMMRWVTETIARHRPGCAFVCGATMAPYLEHHRFGTRVVDMVEVGSAKWRQYAETSHWPLNEFYWRQERALLALETRAASRFDYTLFGSAAEAHLFTRRAPRAPARVVTMRNGVDHDFFSAERDYVNPYPPGRRVVVFAGAMDYPPNIEAAVWFATDVMTMLRHRFPTIDFWMVGDRRARAVRALADRDIHSARGVADPRPYLAYADAVVVPLRIGRGIENNVLEGMAMAKPVIATPAALDGLDFVNGEEVFCSASAPGFASAVAAALGGRADEMGNRARQRIVADCGWDAVLRVLDGLYTPGRGQAALASAS